MARGFLKYKAYPFVDKDPIIDVLRTKQQDVDMKISEISEKGGPATTTLHNWFNGKTKRPQFATVAAAACAMGMTTLPLTAEGRKKLKG